MIGLPLLDPRTGCPGTGNFIGKPSIAIFLIARYAIDSTIDRDCREHKGLLVVEPARVALGQFISRDRHRR